MIASTGPLLGGVLALGLAMAQAEAAGCSLPADVTSRVGRAQEFGYHIADLRVLSGTRDYIWDGNTGTGIVPAGTFSSFYVTGDRAPYQSPPYSGYRLAWYQRHHPNWIVYRPDGKTPAWEFCATLDAACDEPGGVPLAIWLPEVREFIKAGDVHT